MNSKKRYHGDCIGVKNYLTKRIDKFYCHLCRNANKSLRIIYHIQFEQKETEAQKLRFHRQEDVELNFFYKNEIYFVF